MELIPTIVADTDRFCEGVDRLRPDLALAGTLSERMSRLSTRDLSDHDRRLLNEIDARFRASIDRANAWLAEHAASLTDAVASTRLSKAYRHGPEGDGRPSERSR